MKPYAQEAENIKLTLISGIASVQDVVQWADSVIAKLESYDNELGDVSLGGNCLLQEMDSMLRHLGQGAAPYKAIRHLAGRMHRVLLQDKSRARGFARILEQLWVEQDYQVPEDLRFIAGIDDEFCLTVNGVYGTLDDAIASLIADTRKFANSTE